MAKADWLQRRSDEFLSLAYKLNTSKPIGVYVKITPNGEVTLDKKSGIYTVWDETYSDFIFKTKDIDVALTVYEDYGVRLTSQGVYKE